MENWKQVVGYEGLYEISSVGQVRSVLRKVWNPGRKCYRTQYSRILKQTLDSHGYKRVTLSKDGNINQFLVHRLVAIAFIPNPYNYSQINHKNEIKDDNSVSNLEWCNNEYNCNYGNHNSHISEAQSISVLQFNLDGSFVKEWKSAREAERKLGISNVNILRCCHGGFFHKGRNKWVKIMQTNGFMWKFK